jgi:hypothetical protein
LEKTNKIRQLEFLFKTAKMPRRKKQQPNPIKKKTNRQFYCIRCLSSLPCQKCEMEMVIIEKDYSSLEHLLARGYDANLIWERYHFSAPSADPHQPPWSMYSIPDTEINPSVFQGILRGQLLFLTNALRLINDLILVVDVHFLIMRYLIEPLPFLDPSEETKELALQLLGDNPQSLSSLAASIEKYQVACSVFDQHHRDKRVQKTYGDRRLRHRWPLWSAYS